MGGIESHIIQLISGLIESSQCEIDIVLWQHYDEEHPINQKLINSRCSFFSAHGKFSYLIDYLKKYRPIIHTHGYKAGILGRIAGQLTRLAVISTYHNGDPGKGRVRFYNWLDRITSFFSMNIAVNESIAESIHQCQIMPNFVEVIDQDQFTKHVSHRYQVAFIGRLSIEKGPDLFAEITRELPFTCVVYGDGPMMGTLSKEYPHLFFNGMSNMDKYWQEIKVVIMPSRYEGLPLAALEAMARGIPVIASDAGALPSLVNGSGIGKIISNHSINSSVDEYRKAILELMSLDNAAYQRQGQKLIGYIEDNFSRQQHIPKILSYYRLALAQ
jgi:hypothetical protein